MQTVHILKILSTFLLIFLLFIIFNPDFPGFLDFGIGPRISHVSCLQTVLSYIERVSSDVA